MLIALDGEGDRSADPRVLMPPPPPRPRPHGKGVLVEERVPESEDEAGPSSSKGPRSPDEGAEMDAEAAAAGDEEERIQGADRGGGGEEAGDGGEADGDFHFPRPRIGPKPCCLCPPPDDEEDEDEEEDGAGRGADETREAAAKQRPDDKNKNSKNLGELLGPFLINTVAETLWAHRQCIMWCPEVYYDRKRKRTRNVSAALKRSRLLRCSYCDERGATIGCTVERCTR